jgi:hypothetical protein
MKSLTRGLLVLLLMAVPVLGMAISASANTEMVPASRLAVPLVDVSSGRTTFLLLTNVSANIPLTNAAFNPYISGTPLITISNAATLAGINVHLEFYNASCVRTDRNVLLTPLDIDQLDLGAGGTGPVMTTHCGTPIGRCFVDIDIRIDPGGNGDPSVQANVLLGTVVISDFTNDFAFAYPAASIIGSAQSGLLGTIVTRDAQGTAVTWTGRYEALPPRVLVPGFFAEGTGTGAQAGQVFTTLLAIAGFADGNWSGVDSGTDGTATLNNGEAPGQQIPLGNDAGTLMSFGATLFDGCEQPFSANFSSHYFNNTLGSVWTSTITDRVNWTAANCGQATRPGLDEFSGQPVGWIDLENGTRSASAGTRSSTSTAGGTGVNRPRGLAGVFLENVVGGTPTVKLGDATRLWGDCSFTGRESTSPNTNCQTSNGAATETAGCQCTLVDTVCHLDSARSPSSFPTNLGGGQACP